MKNYKNIFNKGKVNKFKIFNSFNYIIKIIKPLSYNLLYNFFEI